MIFCYPLSVSLSKGDSSFEVLMPDDDMTRIIRIVYEVNGSEYEAVPITQEDATAVGITSVCTGGDPCSGDRTCIRGHYYRCMLNHATKRCQWYRTNEPC